MRRESKRMRVGIEELSAHNFDLLPILYRDAGTEVRWVRVATREEPLARLAELLGFPVIAGREVEAASLAEVDVVLVRRMAPALRAAVSGAGIRWSRVLDHGPRR